MADVIVEKLSNGLQVLFLPLHDVEYTACRLLIGGGLINDPENRDGLSLVLAEMTSRGAGGKSSRELATAFDAAGIRHSESASLLHFAYRSSFLPDKLETALDLLSSLVTEPHLDPDTLDPVRSLFLQDLEALRENPARLAMTELRHRYFPMPYNRSGLGTVEGLLSLTAEQVKEEWSKRYGPSQGILSIAGKIELDHCRKVLEDSFGSWQGSAQEVPSMGDLPEPCSVFLEAPGAQQQLVLVYRSAPHENEHYYAAKVLSQILSGGMFGRLFIEVREKRGLCYSVFAQHSARLEYGTVTVYAGTTPERVDQTLSVIQEVLTDPLDSLTDDELNRAKSNLVSQIVLGEESTASRANSNASDWALLGRVRTLGEIKEKVLAVQREDLVALLEAFPLQNPSQLTLGARNFADWNKEDFVCG